MNTEETKSVVRRLHDEVWVKKNVAALDEIISPNFKDDSSEGTQNGGPEYAKNFFNMLFAAFPDLETKQEALIADGDMAAIMWTLTGTNKGGIFGVPATDKKFTARGMDIIKVQDGKIVRDWGGFGDQFPKIMEQIKPDSQ